MSQVRPIQWKSTHGANQSFTLSHAISEGLASDGGLYIPDSLPRFDVRDFDGLQSHPEIAEKMLAPFFLGDALAAHLSEICSQAFDFPLVLRPYGKEVQCLELFHGPTAAFKDFGARFLARAMRRLRENFTVLVATSGDTGGAVASAFWKLDGCRAVILFPKGRVSARQQKQLTSWGENVQAFAVDGDFDACQKMVKVCFQDQGLRERLGLTSANSINVGRLLPQCTYYAAASLWHFRKTGQALNLIVPTGNLGNALSAIWARAMGFPIGSVTLATNENRTLSDFAATGLLKPAPTVPTLANAMDVGNPSNLERLLALFPTRDSWMQNQIRVEKVSDASIRTAIKEAQALFGEALCPHTATALHTWLKHQTPNTAIVATAHPAKFESIVEPLLGRSVEIPPALQVVLSRPEHFETISADPAVLSNRL